MVSPSELLSLLIANYVTELLLCSMKLDKAIVQRRLDLMAAEGVVRHHHLLSVLFTTNVLP
jgi:hypothetical protein